MKNDTQGSFIILNDGIMYEIATLFAQNNWLKQYVTICSRMNEVMALVLFTTKE